MLVCYHYWKTNIEESLKTVSLRNQSIFDFFKPFPPISRLKSQTQAIAVAEEAGYSITVMSSVFSDRLALHEELRLLANDLQSTRKLNTALEDEVRQLQSNNAALRENILNTYDLADSSVLFASLLRAGVIEKPAESESCGADRKEDGKIVVDDDLASNERPQEAEGQTMTCSAVSERHEEDEEGAEQEGVASTEEGAAAGNQTQDEDDSRFAAASATLQRVLLFHMFQKGHHSHKEEGVVIN